jgi:hypothetical protein
MSMLSLSYDTEKNTEVLSKLSLLMPSNENNENVFTAAGK